MSDKVLYGVATVSSMTAFALVQFSAVNADVQTPVNTANAVEAANWADNVTVTVNEARDRFRFESDGIPSHGFAEQYLIPSDPADQPFADKPADFFTVVDSDEFFSESPIDTMIPTQPSYVDGITDTSLGLIGVAITGAQIFNDYEDPSREIVAQDDQAIHDHVAFLDECNGHTLVDGTNYHYHGIPVCITADMDQEGEHSLMIGVLADGFPVYGNSGVGGAIVTNADLDECSGHFGPTPEFPDGIYHYHLTADEAPYMINCYHGEIPEDIMAAGSNQPDFNAVATQLGVTEQALKDSLGDDIPPDFATAAETLGVSEDDLRHALPSPGNNGG